MNEVKCMKYDLTLLENLNKEYEKKPILKTFRLYDDKSQFMYADYRLENLIKIFPFRGKRVLEVGCGGGHVSSRLASHYQCEVTGIDIYKNDAWDKLRTQKNLNLLVIDLSKTNPFPPNSFDIIVSFVAWEHMIHPFKVLEECVKILKDNGKLYINANQYRSALASHLYRTIHFPYPHLLFSDEVIIKYCLKKGVSQEWIDSNFYVNKLTYSHYKEYFRLLNLKMEYEHLIKRKLDLDFYNRFKDKLALYPKFDLELDFFNVLLSKQL